MIKLTIPHTPFPPDCGGVTAAGTDVQVFVRGE